MTGCATTAKTDWRQAVDEQLPALGHRNWIVVADSAYPRQSAPGINTIYTGADHLETLRTVLQKLDAAEHVTPVILLDAELKHVAEKDAPGVQAYRRELRSMLEGEQIKTMNHEDIIRELDEGSKLFNILLLKTDLTIPYTSVFLQLDCKYWSAEKEMRLRKALEEAKQ